MQHSVNRRWTSEKVILEQIISLKSFCFNIFSSPFVATIHGWDARLLIIYTIISYTHITLWLGNAEEALSLENVPPFRDLFTRNCNLDFFHSTSALTKKKKAETSQDNSNTEPPAQNSTRQQKPSRKTRWGVYPTENRLIKIRFS